MSTGIIQDSHDRVDALVDAVGRDDLAAVLVALRSLQAGEIDVSHRKTARTALQTAVAESVIPEDARVLCLQMLLLSGASPSHGGVNSAWMLALENDREKCEKSMTDFRRHGAGHGDFALARQLLMMTPDEQAAWIESKKMVEEGEIEESSFGTAGAGWPFAEQQTSVDDLSRPMAPCPPAQASTSLQWSIGAPQQTPHDQARPEPPPSPIAVHLLNPGSFILRLAPFPEIATNRDITAIVNAVAPAGSVIALALVERSTKARGRSALVCFAPTVKEKWIQERLQGITVEKSRLTAGKAQPRIFLGNLPAVTKPSDLQAIMQTVGVTTVQASVPGNQSGNKRRYGFVQLDSFQTCADVINRLQSATIGGVPLTVGWPREDLPDTPRPKLDVSFAVSLGASSSPPPPHLPTPAARRPFGQLPPGNILLSSLPLTVDRTAIITFLSLAVAQNRIRDVKMSPGAKGEAVVTLASMKDCELAVKALDGSAMNGSVVSVSIPTGSSIPQVPISQSAGASAQQSSSVNLLRAEQRSNLKRPAPESDGLDRLAVLQARKQAREGGQEGEGEGQGTMMRERGGDVVLSWTFEAVL